jgi:phosphomannomutase
MKLINQALKEKNLTVRQLPSNIQQEIESFRGMILKYNEACDEYDEEPEQDAETVRKLDEMEDYIARTENELANKISGKQVTVAADGGATTTATTVPKKEDNSVGWLIFGGIALVATFGLVNVFKKR